MSLTMVPNSRNWSGQMRLCCIFGKYNDCGKTRTNVVKVMGQSYATAAVTIRTSEISFISGWKPATDTFCDVSEITNEFLPNAHVSACVSSSHRVSCCCDEYEAITRRNVDSQDSRRVIVAPMPLLFPRLLSSFVVLFSLRSV